MFFDHPAYIGSGLVILSDDHFTSLTNAFKILGIEYIYIRAKLLSITYLDADTR
jgi:hypothetical protein